MHQNSLVSRVDGALVRSLQKWIILAIVKRCVVNFVGGIGFDSYFLGNQVHHNSLVSRVDGALKWINQALAKMDAFADEYENYYTTASQ